MDIVTLLNQKGGVGKTSTTHHLAGTLARMGRSVLLVDNDPQSSLSQGLYGPAEALSLDPAVTIHAIHTGEQPFPEDIIRPTGILGIDLVPGSEAAGVLNARDPQSLGSDDWDRLKDFLVEAGPNYEVCLIDCPPNLYYCSWVALVASDGLVVPMQAEDYGVQGIAAVRRSIELVQAGPNPSLRLLGYLLTMVGRKAIHQVNEEILRETYGPLIFETVIPEAVHYVEAITNRKPIADYKPKSAAARVMQALADELVRRIESGPPPAIARDVAFPITEEAA